MKMKQLYLLTSLTLFCLMRPCLAVHDLRARDGREYKYDAKGEGNLKHEILGHYNVHKDKITLSGFSSGGTFAQHLQISYSSLFSGIATFCHAYYRCGPGNGKEGDYDDACTILTPTKKYNYQAAVDDIKEYERKGLIESTKNLQNQKLYVAACSRSAFFSLELSLAVIDVYTPYIQNENAIQKKIVNAGQLLPTVDFGTPCQEPGTVDMYFLGNCGFSVAYDAVNFLLGDQIHNPQPTSGTKANLDNLKMFSQTEFFIGLKGKPLMDDVGYIYIPDKCSRGDQCFLHFYFHGCLTGREFNGTHHLVNSGYLELAEANGIIIVTPQAIGNKVNTIGCWDTYGLTGNYYATKQGLQVTVVRKILGRILGEKEHTHDKIVKRPPKHKNRCSKRNYSFHLITTMALVVTLVKRNIL